jgi:hypothetical protein
MMANGMMNITIGNIVVGADFFDREDVIENIWETLQTDSILLAAPRRVGKSSIMRRLFDQPRFGFRPIWLDCQDYGGPEDLVTDLTVKAGELRQDPRHFFRHALKSVLGNIEELGIWQLKLKLREQVANNWQSQGESVLKESLAQPDTRLLIIFDELPILLHKLMTRDSDRGKAAAQDLLDWLRHVRQSPEFGRDIRQVIGGSIGLPRIASLIGSSHKINDLRPVEVGPLERSKAAELANGLLESRGIALSEVTMEAFLGQVGTFLPIFIQILASAVAAEVQKRRASATPELIRECYEQRALGPEFRSCFEDFYERLDRYYAPDESRAAKRVLKELAVSFEPLSRSQLLGAYAQELGDSASESGFDFMLTWLADDFYICANQAGQFGFKTMWLRDWWRRYHVSTL